MTTRALESAIRHADARAARNGERITVYHAARDKWGRDAVFYVRSDAEGAPITETLGKYETVYRADPPSAMLSPPKEEVPHA